MAYLDTNRDRLTSSRSRIWTHREKSPRPPRVLVRAVRRWRRIRPSWRSSSIAGGSGADGQSVLRISLQRQYSVLDYAGDQDAVIVPIIAWIAEHQPELLQRQDSEPFGFESEWLAQDKQDLSITIDLTERVAVQRVTGGITTSISPTRCPRRLPRRRGCPNMQGLAKNLAAGETAIVAPR